MEIHLIRHTAVKNMDSICYGQSDVALNDDFLLSFETIKTDDHYDEVISSPLSRCTKLADFLAFDYQTEPRLKELNFGKWELQEWEEIDRNTLQSWSEDYINGATPEGESLQAMEQRVVSFLEEIFEKHPNGKVLLVTHAGVIRIIISHINKTPLTEMFSIKVGFGELLKVKMV